ncbi:hypothetical protein FRC02_006165 [Tulasnella sp. 418]|nr:hypothetical protein FRC02_006165 [Tulasnella sp. 418]
MPGVKHANDNQFMTDDDDEGDVVVARKTSSTPQPSSKPQSSTKTTAKPKTKQVQKRAPSPINEVSDDQEDEVEDFTQELSDDNRPGPSSSSKNTIRSSSKPIPNGKSKPPSQTAVKRKATSTEELSSTEKNESPPPKRPKINPTSSSSAAQSLSKNSKAFANMQAEVKQLREEAEALRQERDSFASQFDSLAKLRQTDAEVALTELRNITDARAQSQETLIETLTGEIANMKELARDGHIHGIKLLTTEARDAKLQELDAKLRDKDEALREQSSLVSELTQQVKDLEKYLQAERDNLAHERARANSRRHMSSSPTRPTAPRPAATPAALAEAGIKFGLYEDLTGIVIVGVKSQKSQDHKKEIIKFSCLYTVNERDTLPFEITIFPPSSSDGKEEDEVMYNPLLNDNQPLHPDFKNKLSFLAHGFTFIRSQLPSFLRTLSEVFSPPKKEGEEEGEEDGEEEGEEEGEEGEGDEEGTYEEAQ